jgi:hypothetical protein
MADDLIDYEDEEIVKEQQAAAPTQKGSYVGYSPPQLVHTSLPKHPRDWLPRLSAQARAAARDCRLRL